MAKNLSLALQRALEAGDFEAVGKFVTEYRKAVKTDLALARSLEERKCILREAIETLEKQLQLARVTRSHIWLRLQNLAAQIIYRASEPQNHTWKLQA